MSDSSDPRPSEPGRLNEGKTAPSSKVEIGTNWAGIGAVAVLATASILALDRSRGTSLLAWPILGAKTGKFLGSRG